MINSNMREAPTEEENDQQEKNQKNQKQEKKQVDHKNQNKIHIPRTTKGKGEREKKKKKRRRKKRMARNREEKKSKKEERKTDLRKWQRRIKNQSLGDTTKNYTKKLIFNLLNI